MLMRCASGACSHCRRTEAPDGRRDLGWPVRVFFMALALRYFKFSICCVLYYSSYFDDLPVHGGGTHDFFSALLMRIFRACRRKTLSRFFAAPVRCSAAGCTRYNFFISLIRVFFFLAHICCCSHVAGHVDTAAADIKSRLQGVTRIVVSPSYCILTLPRHHYSQFVPLPLPTPSNRILPSTAPYGTRGSRCVAHSPCACPLSCSLQSLSTKFLRDII